MILILQFYRSDTTSLQSLELYQHKIAHGMEVARQDQWRTQFLPQQEKSQPTKKNPQQTKKVHRELPLLCKTFFKFLARMTTVARASKGEI